MKVQQHFVAIFAGLAIASVCFSGGASAQSTPTSQEVTEVLQQIKSLNDALRETRAELEQSRAEIRELKTTVENLQASMTVPAPPGSVGEKLTSATEKHNTPLTQEDLQLLAERVDEHQQTKVESTSKFRVKLSGLVLLNGFTNFGAVDNVDLPSTALSRPSGTPDGSTGGTMRQSIIGLTGFGPDLLGARTSGDLQLDFYGGVPAGYNGSSSGLARLRIGRLRMDWQNTSLVGGVDTPFFSPNSPTSYMTVGEPALAAAGNLWAWVPSVRGDYRFNSESVDWKIEAGLFDSAGYAGYAPQVRYPAGGENSRQPAYSVRFSGTHGEAEHALTVGFSGLYAPQHFYNGTIVHGAGVMADWKIPIISHIEASGEFFTGKGLQTFGGTPYALVLSQNATHFGTVTIPLLAGIGEIGGWSQVKFRVDPKNEFNVAAGYGGYNSTAMREAISYDYYFSSLPSRNESLLVNYIVRPRSDLLFSAEYRRIKTTLVSGASTTADQVGLAAGFLF